MRSGFQDLFQMHKDIVCAYPPNVEHLGSSNVCEVQGSYIPKKVITVQGHPEFNEDIVRELLDMRHEQGVCDDEMYANVTARIGDRHDGVLVAQAFLRVLVEQ